jgi:hypothetical protein
LDGRATQILPAQKADEGPKIIPQKLVPNGRRLPFRLTPAPEFTQRLPVITLRVNRSAAIGGKMRLEFLNPRIGNLNASVLRIGLHLKNGPRKKQFRPPEARNLTPDTPHLPLLTPS